MAAQGRIFEIQRLAMYDGPGIRTVIYLKGCPLRCVWCHNPEGQIAQAQLFYDAEKCVNCGLCVPACPTGAHTLAAGAHRLRRERCTGCGRCASRCGHGALAAAGRLADTQELLAEILHDRPFYRDRGGVTLSGGEPLMQGDFSRELLTLAKEAGIHTCVETCGYASGETVEGIAQATDLFLYDIKELNPQRHKALTGVDNRRILENLELLDRLQKPVILRCPIVPGQNMRPEHFEGIADLARRLDCVEAVELEPYHPLGLSKYARLGWEPAFALGEFLEPEALGDWAAAMAPRAGKPVRLSTGEPLPGG